MVPGHAPVRRLHVRPWLVGCAATALALAVAACGGSASTTRPSSRAASRSTSTRGATASAVTLPVIGDFTGSDAFFGTGQVEGMGPVLAKLNADGGVDGHPVKLVECDTKSSVSGAAECAAKFSSDPVVLTVSVIANIKAALPSLTHSIVLASTNLLNPPRSSNAFQTAPAGATVDQVVDKIAKASGFTSIGIIATDDAVGESQLTFIKAAAGSIKLDIQFVSPSASDDTVPLEKLVTAHVPMIYAAALGAAGTAVIHAYKDLSPSIPLVVTGADASYSFLKAISSYEPSSDFYTIPGTPLTAGDVPAGDRSAFAAYVHAFESSYGHPPDTIDVSGAYAIDVAVALLKGAGLHPSVSQAEQWLHSHTVSSLTTVSFTNPKLNVLSNVPPGFDRITGTSFQAASLHLP